MDKKDITISGPLILDGKVIRYFAYTTYAGQFIIASEAIVQTSPVKLFLLSRAIELLLKSFLLMERVDKNELRRIGHKLGVLYDLARQKGLREYVALSSEEVEVLREVSVPYSETELAYPELENVLKEYRAIFAGADVIPELKKVEEIANRMRDAISSLAIKKASTESIVDAPKLVISDSAKPEEKKL